MLSGLRNITGEALTGDIRCLQHVVKDVYKILTKTKLLVKEKLLRLAPNQLTPTGEIFYRYSCADYTLMTGYILRRLSVGGRLVINELQGKHGPKVHFAVETEFGFIDHVIGNSVIIGLGELPNFYERLTGETISRQKRVDIRRIRDSDTILDVMGSHPLRKGPFSDHAVDILADQLEQENTPKRWEDFVRRAGGDVKKPTTYLQY